MGMHISTAWVVAYNLMDLVTTYCSLPIISTQQFLLKGQQLRQRRRRHHNRSCAHKWKVGLWVRELAHARQGGALIYKGAGGRAEAKSLCAAPALDLEPVFGEHNRIVEG